MSSIKNVITHLYKADVEIPVHVSVDVDRQDEIYVDKTFSNLNSANDYINNKEYEDNLDTLISEKQSEVSDDLFDRVEVDYDSTEEAKTEVKAISVDELSDYEVREFLILNPTYQMSTVEITAQIDETGTEMKKIKVFVEVVHDQPDQRVSAS